MPLCVASGDTLVASGRSICKLRFVSVPIDCSKRSVTFRWVPHEPNGRARLPNPCGRLVTALAGAPQAQRSVRPERVRTVSGLDLVSHVTARLARYRMARMRNGGVGWRSRTVCLASTHPRAHSRARLAHTWFDLILKERYLQRAIPMPGRRSCTYCRSGTPPRRADSRAAAVAAIRRSNLPWKRATLLCSTYG